MQEILLFFICFNFVASKIFNDFAGKIETADVTDPTKKLKSKADPKKIENADPSFDDWQKWIESDGDSMPDSQISGPKTVESKDPYDIFDQPDEPKIKKPKWQRKMSEGDPFLKMMSQDGDKFEKVEVQKVSEIPAEIQPENPKLLAKIDPIVESSDLHPKLQNITVIYDHRPEYEKISEMDWDQRDNYYQNRLSQIKSICRRHSGDQRPENLSDFLKTATNVTFPIIVDEKNKLLYCEIPKAGSTNWKRVLIKIANDDLDGKYRDIKNVLAIRKPRKSSHHELKYLSDFPISQQIKLIHDLSFKKFTFVRHPFERLLSAYKDKVNVDFLGKYSDKILKYYQTTNNLDKFEKYDIESFHKFIEFVVAGAAARNNQIRGIKERHWSSYFNLCQFCQINYDFVGKLESVIQDSFFWLKKVGLGNRVSYPFSLTSINSDLIRKYYSGINSETFNELMEIFEDDFEAFEYFHEF